MFPLLAKPHGVLERSGHTEATVDLCRLAGLKECGLCCEIMREDGTMMRASELQQKAAEWGLKFITIRDLQSYRKRHEKLVDLSLIHISGCSIFVLCRESVLWIVFTFQSFFFWHGGLVSVSLSLIHI